MTGKRTNVAVIGYGPVGQVMAALLAQRGWDVVVVERWPQPYTMPRAVVFDGESARILASAGIDPSLGEFGKPTGDYVWRNGEGQDLLHFTGIGDRGPQGWPITTSMYQPGLEAALIERGGQLPGLEVFRGYEAVRVEDSDRGVRVVAESGDESLEVVADWVVGCDGANSFVRDRIGSGFTELGFSHDWLICDVTLRPVREYSPDNLQVCDPARPRTAVSAGPGHRRWEFMRVPGETLEELDSPRKAWELLAIEGITSENATLDRHAVYTFKAGHAERWRSGRMLLAGDAAHLMPPFAGQGMSSGFRDAANLAWKLDLVLSGSVGEHVVDTYPAERREHVQYAITKSVELGRVICEPDPEAARARDEKMLAAREQAGESDGVVLDITPLRSGLLHAPGEDSPAGELTPQGTVSTADASGLFDEVVGRGFALIALEPRLVDDARLAYLKSLRANVVHVLPAGSALPEAEDGAVRTVVDTGDVYVPYLTGLGAVAILVRPDFYLFGAARDQDGAAALIDDLRTQLSPGGAGR
ncbi:bifunctional 3-(3-hydroxy-phenyl)propionate/3-hydroxycinnamic acid hydroxylase [Saccharopolyspora erythraea]|uniref:bifunctional 3-(3-hydroxy-phenyl)propionate/3-hydroxycinnamic acid hydroxylase MhpA n=1 Tax=Saccharopolyspora erythraea TaxID=1836 RepID=UPI001BA7E1C2|nr:bifunctional 3-(3-hydroxy-phenyl)propionate/3-hydroxycinnamic acid hydroxylase [Saccharopolyspora erythraea]QUH03577.1 bifunctional 3-(3-hydroxy-phenyl)propionate/3-hydroxycinnamic acid hydroxylase [Saccharopolyspora erythraea]